MNYTIFTFIMSILAAVEFGIWQQSFEAGCFMYVASLIFMTREGL